MAAEEVIHFPLRAQLVARLDDRECRPPERVARSPPEPLASSKTQITTPVLCAPNSREECVGFVTSDNIQRPVLLVDIK
jgi:hypothetical protein